MAWGAAWEYVNRNAVEVWLVLATMLLVAATYLVITRQRKAAIRPVVIFRQDKNGKAAIVNVGVGTALNIAVWFVGGGDSERRWYDALQPEGSTHMEEWGWLKAPEQVWLRYTDAENSPYFSRFASPLGSGPTWVVGKGGGPKLPPAKWSGVPKVHALPIVGDDRSVFSADGDRP